MTIRSPAENRNIQCDPLLGMRMLKGNRLQVDMIDLSSIKVQQSKVAVRVGEQLLIPPQISAQVLRKLKEDAEATLGKTISQAVMVDHDGILHVLAEDASTEGEPVEKTFDRFYRLTPQEVEQKLKEALVHRDEDAIASRLFQLEEELTRLRRVINKEKTSDTLLLESLDNLELSIQDRNVTQAEELLAELKSKL